LNRLLQANAVPEQDSDGDKLKELGAAEPEPPALLRRASPRREEAPAALASLSAPVDQSSANIDRPSESPVILAASGMGTLQQASASLPAEANHQTAVLDREPASISMPAVGQEPVDEDPPPAGMSGFLVEFPLAAPVEAAAIAVASVAHLASSPRAALPRLEEFPRETSDGRLEPAGRVPLSLFTQADSPTPPRERGLELREFVHGLPHVEVRVRPASETGLDLAGDPFEVRFAAFPTQDAPNLWLASQEELPAIAPSAEVLLGDLARLDFATTGWEKTVPDGAGTESPAVSEIPAGIGSAPLEPLRVEPIQLDPASREGWRPEPMHFEPVHVDPVFMEQVAHSAEFKAEKAALGLLALPNSRGLSPSKLVPSQAPSSLRVPDQDDAVALDQPASASAALETAEAKAVPAMAAPAASIEAAPPPTITKPMPVTLHGLAPARGKPVQVFTAPAPRSGDIQVPRDTGLPLRPIMILAAAPKPSSAASSNDQTAPAGKPVKSVPVPEKREPRTAEFKPRRSEVRILPVQLRDDDPKRPKEQLSGRIEPAKLDRAKPDQIEPQPAKPEPSKPAPAKEPAVAAATPKETAPKETPAGRAAPAQPVEVKPAAPSPAQAKAGIAPPAEDPDLLGLPKLSFENSENFWTRLPLLVRVGIVAAVLALVVGGVMLTSRGSGASKTPAVSDREPDVVETGSALANTAGWEQDWFSDRRQGRHVDVLRGSMSLHDYRLVFAGQIEHGALGWVFRANDQSFYVEKIQVVTPGRDTVVALVRFAVIKGQEQPRTQIPLPIQAHLDTTYKVRMDVVGDRFTTWVQDIKVDQWTDNQIGAGGVGLYYDSGDSAKLRDTLNVIPLKLR
jgi:hypothetical protein